MAIEVTSVHDSRRLPRLKRDITKKQHLARRGFDLRVPLRLLGILIALACGAVLIAFGYFYFSYSKIVDRRLASGYLTSRAGIYAAPRVLQVGQNISRARMVEILRRAGYVETEASNVWSGRYVIEADAVVIKPRHLETDAVLTPDSVRVEIDRQHRIKSITGDGAALPLFTLEPESLTTDPRMKTGKQSALAYDDIPPALVRAILAIEDRRFFEHRGLDVIGIGRALLSWAGSGSDGGPDLKQGGSTITQQLVKNTYLSPERTLRRKFKEAVVASVLERRLSKEDIFALYCNEIYLGQRGSVAVRGVAHAAQVFFGKPLSDLSLAEAAIIAGMIQSPGHYAPDRHPEKSKARRNLVLAAMLRDGAITAEQARNASAAPVAVAPLDRSHAATATHFIDYVNRVVESNRDSSASEHDRHPVVHTTIDLELQQLAETTIERQLARLGKIYKGRKSPEAALVALDPRTGNVLAMVGGRNYSESQLNRATDGRRQPGSVFKPFVYAAALEGGYSPVSMFLDAPRGFSYDRRAKYRPANYGGAYAMRDVTLRTGLIRSLNVVTVDVATRVGLARIAALAEQFGLPKPQAYPALALGTTETTPLEIAAAYAALANGGRFVRPVVITQTSNAFLDAVVAGRAGAASLSPRQTPHVVRPTTAYMITDMLRGVIAQGTGRGAREVIKQSAVAGKTGTSRDGWFAGYTPNLVCVVWVGFDDGEQLNLTGADSALPAWTEFMKGAIELRPELGGDDFDRPAGIAMIDVDPATGMLASASCPQRERIATLSAHAPGFECSSHARPLMFSALDDAELDDSNGVEITPAAGITTTTTTTAAAPATAVPSPPTSPANSYVATPARPLPRAATSAELIDMPLRRGTRTQVEVDEQGRPRLTNEMRAETLPVGSNR